MRHGVNKIVDAESVSQRGQFFGVGRNVGELPGIAHVHVVVDHHHQPTLIIGDAIPAQLLKKLWAPEGAHSACLHSDFADEI